MHLVGEPRGVPGAAAWAPSLLLKSYSQAAFCFWSLFKGSGRRGSGAAHRPAAAVQADTQQSSPLKAGTTGSQKQPAEGTPRPTPTATHPALYLKTHTLE